MFEMNANPLKTKPTFVLLVPCFVLFAACSSKQITNAALEPLDLPTEQSTSSYMTPEPEIAAPARAKRAKKTKSKKGGAFAAAGSVRKKGARKSKPVHQAMTAAELPVVGESTLASTPIEMPLIAPPIPLNPAIETPVQPNWMLAAFIVGGIVALMALAFRMRRQMARKRGLVYN